MDAEWIERANIITVLISVIVSICMLPIVTGKEFLKVDLHQGMRATGVEVAQFISYNR